MNLGYNDTWIKLAEPTAEAIRQAFLGHRSRIRIESPNIPSLVVATAEIKGSTILQSTALTVSPEFNAVIGGRVATTGPTARFKRLLSFLEYIRVALDGAKARRSFSPREQCNEGAPRESRTLVQSSTDA